MPNARQTWPYNGAAVSPEALTQSPDGLLNSGRSLAGPLRLGTAPGVGPRGALLDGLNGRSDFGMDRISPRPYDAIGQKYPENVDRQSRLISRDRSRRRS